MRAYRHTFLGGMFEIRIAPRSDGRAVAEIYTVQEMSLLLQPYSLNGLGHVVRMSEDEAHHAAVESLEERFGRQSCPPAEISNTGRFRVIGRARTA